MATPKRRRQWTRKTVDWSAVVVAGTLRLACRVIDVSIGGARLQIREQLRPRSYVIVICDEFGSLEGRVVWSRNQETGIKFTDAGARRALAFLLR